MRDDVLQNQALAFWNAVDAHDYRRAGESLERYVCHFRTGIRTADEIRNARDLLVRSIRRTNARKAQLSEELMLLKRILDAYGSPLRMHTWRLEA